MSQQLTVSWHFVLTGKFSYTETNGREKWNINDAAAKMSMFRESDLNVGTSQTSHFQAFLHEQHYLFIVPTFPTEQLKRTLRL